jgi:chromosome segregation protein
LYLKSLTLRGFKSFASSTTLRFEPGITAVVGPNGSGKSNVVDALAWVMGEQGAKSLRGGKMEDVIFAGTSGRPPLGRAEVLLTIDNSDGALAIDYTEVTLSRTMFRNGGSEYAINGEPCRLLDVQELLSDSGIGREMHVIVGQGQLDSVLSATPEDRRGFIEEAAGVLKHRKRKEKALRKLDAMAANLTRITDLTAELRRQLKPLGRQAEVARRAAVVQADLRDSRLRLLADDLLRLRSTLEQEVADESALLERRGEVESELAERRSREAALEADIAASLPRLSQAQETWFRLAGLRDRFRATATLASERVRRQARVDEEDQRVGVDPDALEEEASTIREAEAELAAQIALDQQSLAAAEQARVVAEDELHAEEQRIAGVLRVIADRREGLARLTGQVNALRTRAQAGDAEIARLAASAAEASARATAAQAEFRALETQVAGLDAGEVDLDAEHQAASDVLAQTDERMAALREEEREADSDRSAMAARKEALELGLARKDGTGALLAASGRLSGLLGSVAALITVQPGAQTAVAAALGSAADAVAVDGLGAAVDAIRLLKDDDAGRAGLIVGSTGPRADRSSWPPLPGDAQYAVDLVSAPDALLPALHRLLEKVVVVEGLTEARALVSRHTDLIAVTGEGDVLGRDFAAGGSSSAPSLLEVQAAVDEASAALTAASHRCERLRFELSRAGEQRQTAAARVEAALARLHESDARLAAVAEQLGHLGSAARAASAEAARVQSAIDRATQARDEDLAGLAELEQRLSAAESAPDLTEPSTADRDQLALRAAQARQIETEVRLAVRTGEERAHALAGRADELDRGAAAERQARVRLAQRREEAAREAAVARAVGVAIHIIAPVLEQSLSIAADERSAADLARQEHERELAQVRERLRTLDTELQRLTDSVHRDEVARAEQRLRIEQVETKAVEELGVDPESLVAEYGPDQLVPPSLLAPGDPEPEVTPEPTPYDRVTQEKRLRAAERALALLGRVNPLALEEYAALEERQQFLTEQLEDLKKTKRDLLDIVRDVDERIEQVFTAAYQDVEREFVDVFARLFPGGEGRLVLTDSSDLLNTGVDIEARPPGKKVKRLSLLSGGERSLTAVAFLIALFKARPSPFYVLDEVEAALDDTNLGRLLEIYEELRENSQLLIITHQKRTMEVADALYGISMRGDGVSAVISQRLREEQSA